MSDLLSDLAGGYTARLIAPMPNRHWPVETVRGLVGQTTPQLVEGEPAALPEMVIADAWLDSEGWVCARLEPAVHRTE